MEELRDKIERYKQGEVKALEEILIQMTPLVKSYAAKIHFMEYEDAMQELYIALLKCIPKLSSDKTTAESIRYMEVSVKNEYRRLCKKYLALKGKIEIEYLMEGTVSKKDTADLNDVVFFVTIDSFKKNNTRKWMILQLSLKQNMTDAEIARYLGVSRQYINSLRKSVTKEYKEWL